ncbi:zinc finger MYM-type protein 1-like, partial [Aphis craccivora]
SELKNIFPSLYTALCIALTLPVSSASPERAFSKLKLIKTRLRSSMCEERLESLMMISCEKDIPIDTDEVIKCFSSDGVRVIYRTRGTSASVSPTSCMTERGHREDGTRGRLNCTKGSNSFVGALLASHYQDL